MERESNTTIQTACGKGHANMEAPAPESGDGAEQHGAQKTNGQMDSGDTRH